MAAIFFDAAAFGLSPFGQESNLNQHEPQVISSLGYNYTRQVMEPRHDSALPPPSPPQIPDFVVIGEFSEVTGPIPLLTIPSHVIHNKALDINLFIMKIMSIDYHPNPSGHFQSCEDVQVLLNEPGLHSYTHYTMLHDLQARGWVRPICISYVTSDQHKLHDHFDAFRNLFLQITKIMKFNNCRWFMEEILKKLQSLKEMQGKYFQCKKKEVDGMTLTEEEQRSLQNIDFDNIVHQYTEYKHLLHSIEPLLDNEYHQHTIDAWKEGLIFAEVNIPQVEAYLSHLRSETETSSNSPVAEHYLKSIKTLCPWGFAAAVWNLHSILQYHSDLELKSKLVALACNQNSKIKARAFVESALESNEYLHLLSTSTQPICGPISDDPSMLSSVNEASSSYHSVAESMSDLPRDADQKSGQESNNESDNESYLDISEARTDESDTEDETERVNACVWNSDSSNLDSQCGYRLLKFFRVFDKVSCPVLYSLLIGRTVVICGNEPSGRRVARLVDTLSCLVPVSEGHKLSTLPWHCGILVPEHIRNNQLIGLCVPERLSLHDMISHKDKNTVTILDMESQQLFGPAYYSGQLLSSLDRIVQRVTNDKGLLLYLRSVAATIEERLFVFKMVVPEQITDIMLVQTLKDLQIQDCDANVIKFFRKLKP